MNNMWHQSTYVWDLYQLQVGSLQSQVSSMPWRSRCRSLAMAESYRVELSWRYTSDEQHVTPIHQHTHKGNFGVAICWRLLCEHFFVLRGQRYSSLKSTKADFLRRSRCRSLAMAESYRVELSWRYTSDEQHVTPIHLCVGPVSVTSRKSSISGEQHAMEIKVSITCHGWIL